jgi:predicted NBD/HSP70 family sugar kinase
MPEPRGSNNRTVRSANRALLLRLLATSGPASRAALARQVGLTRMSITYIVQEMLAEGLVVEIDAASPPGRSGVRLALAEARITALGLYLSRDAVVGTVADIATGPLHTQRLPLDPDEDSAGFSRKVLALVADLQERDRALRAARGMPGGLRPSGLGVAALGPIDIRDGRILDPPNFHRISDVPVRALLEGVTDLPIRIDNDMNAAALAEMLYGDARGVRDFVYLGITNGVGAGIVSDGRLFEGGAGFAGEVGHMSIDFEGPPCSCGNRGCLERYASLPFVFARYRGKLPDDTADAFATLVARARTGEAEAVRVLDDLFQSLSVALVNLANVLDPDVVVLGHEAALAGDLLAGRLERAVNARMFQHATKHLPVHVSAFLDQAPVRGATALVFDRIFQGVWVP